MKAAPVVKTLLIGSMSIAIRKYGDDRFGFDYTPPGEMRRQIRHGELTDAEARARELLTAVRAGKVERFAISEDEYAQFMRWKGERRQAADIPALVAQYIASKEISGSEPTTIRALKSTLLPFAEAFRGSIADVERSRVETWLNERKLSPARWNAIVTSLRTLWRHARHNWLLPAELTPVELIPKRKVKTVVLTYSPAELAALLKAVGEISDEWLPLIVLGAFSGLRPEEICPDPRNRKPGLRWENILWSKGKIDVRAEVAKDRRRRFAPLTPAAVAWLKPLRGSGDVVPRRTHAWLHPRWGERAGVPWKKDGLRHSFASYRLALTRDMAALSLEMGNSPAIIHRHYLDLKHRPEAIRWFALRPSNKSNISDRPETSISS